MRRPRVRLTARRLMPVIAATIMVWDLCREGIYALIWEAPLLGALLAMGVARRRFRLGAGVTGGAVTGLCFFFVNWFFKGYTTISIMGPSGPIEEAVAGCIWGSMVGLLAGAAASIDCRRPRLRLTVRAMMIAVGLSAAILAGVVSLVRMAPGQRALMAVMAVLVGAPSLILIESRTTRIGPDDVETDSSRDRNG
jgi:hypothetical protein